MQTLNLHTPTGEKEICISEDNSHTQIYLNDTEHGNRSFTLTLILTGDHSKVDIVGRAFSTQSEKKIWNITIRMEGKHQKADLSLKGVADEKSTLEFHGGGVLKENSRQGNVNIQEHIILFSKHAKAKATPLLRVETEHVDSASHSASIAPFSQELFFYLESRGVNTLEAKNILKQGFLHSNTSLPQTHEN